MRKRYALFAACLLWTALAWPHSADAAARPVRVYLDGKPVTFEVQPILENGTTLVQFRPIFEKLGLTIGWDPDTQTVTGTRDDMNIKLVINDTEAYINGLPSELELAPRLVGGNTLVPLRFVSEACGKEVSWVQSTSSVYLKSPAPSKESGGSKGTTARPKPADPADNSKQGKGDYLYPNGDKYTGQLYNGLPEGKGKIVSAAGKTLFEGTITNGTLWEGRLKTYFENGQIEFDGQLKDGVASGAGKQYSSAGSLVFDGTFAGGERDKGTLYYSGGDKYTGPFDNDKPNGSGKLVYKNGDVYEGDFVDGNREGKGTYTTPKGDKIVGDFKNNAMDGVISHYDKKGNLLSVSEYASGALIRKVDMGSGSTTLPNTNPSSQSGTLNAENERHDQAVKEIKDRYALGKKQLDDQIAQVRKDNPGLYTSQAEYDKAYNEAVAKQKELISKMNSLTSDNSNAAAVARAELEKQLTESQTLVGQMITKGTAQRLIEDLKEQLALLKDGYNTELKRENEAHAAIIKRLK